MVPVLSAVVSQNGRLQFTPDERYAMNTWLGTMVGQRVEIVIRKRHGQRSCQQNRYYFGVVVKLLADYCGYDPHDMHETLAMKFLRIDDCPITGAPRRRRTPQTDTAEFAAYIDWCIRLAAELGVVIPEPSAVGDFPAMRVSNILAQ